MESTTVAVIASLVAGFSTGLGALPIFFKRDFSRKTLDLGMGLSAGIMLVAAFIALILPALDSGREIYGEVRAPIWIAVSLFTGYLFIVFIHEFIPHEHFIKHESLHSRKKLSRVAMIVMAIALHNIPEGLTVGVGFGSEDITGGLSLAIAISIQNMPEGLVVALGMLNEGASRKKAFTIALLSGLIEPVAAVFGFLSTQVTSYSLPVSLAFAGGAMLFVTIQEIFPELFKEGHEKRATVGVISGIVTMLLIDYYLG